MEWDKIEGIIYIHFYTTHTLNKYKVTKWYNKRNFFCFREEKMVGYK